VISEPVTLISWLWQGWRAGEYDYRHVNRLHRQLKQHMTGPWKMVCITDQPKGIECETYPLWDMPTPYIPNSACEKLGLDPAAPNCFCRLKLFEKRTAQKFGNLLMSIDLDTTVYADLRPLLTADSFKIAINENRRATKFCGTLWQMRPGAAPQLWKDYHPGSTPQAIRSAGMRGSDQSWFSLKVPDAPYWTRRDGVYWVKRLPLFRKRPENARVVYFAGNIKPWSEKCLTMALYTPL
jgi:hypothetical protein